jgi:hypothetical protein
MGITSKLTSFGFPVYDPETPPSGFHYSMVIDPLTGGTLDIVVPAHNLCSMKDAVTLAAELQAELVDLVPIGLNGKAGDVHLLGTEDRIFSGLKGIPGTPADQPIGPNGEEVYCAKLLQLKYSRGVGAPGHWERTADGSGFIFDAGHGPVWVDDPIPAPAPAPVNHGGEIPPALGGTGAAGPSLQDVMQRLNFLEGQVSIIIEALDQLNQKGTPS